MLFHTEQSLDGQLHSSVLASADMRRTGRPRTVHIDVAGSVIAQCLEGDRRWSLAHTMTTVHKILREDLHMRKIAAKWVPHALTEQQQWYHYDLYSSGKVSKLMKHGLGLMNLS